MVSLVIEQTVQFREICDTYRPRILRYLTRLVGQAEAEDITQDVLIKVGKSLQQFRGDSALNTWIYRIVTNSAIDSLRRRNASRILSSECGEIDEDKEGPSVEETAPSVEADVIRTEMSRCIQEFVARLSEDYRIVMVLSEMEGFSNAEIANIIGVSLDTVKIRLHRARQRLRQELSTGCNFHRDERNEFACDRKP
jgi:RNA polymerase sigma-70 factor (ECF subfamily)